MKPKQYKYKYFTCCEREDALVNIFKYLSAKARLTGSST